LNKLRLLLIVFIFFIAGCEPVPQDVYKVVKIKDGDTIELLSADYQNITVRLAGIDCPEKAQDYGQKARQYTALLCFGKDVKMEGDTKDRYGRTVATIILPDGKSLNYELVRNGYAWHYKAYSKNPELDNLEQYARSNRLGLWQDENPVAPWLFRKKKTKRKPRKKRKPKMEVVSLTSHYTTINEIY
jgi:micrococcal nuclease